MKDLPVVVGIERSFGGSALRRFATVAEAEDFVGTLLDAEDGRYYIDAPEELVNGPRAEEATK